MFWIGLIVGMIVGVIAFIGVGVLVLNRVCGMSWDEYWDSCGAVITAAENRESQLQVVRDGEVLESVTYEER